MQRITFFLFFLSIIVSCKKSNQEGIYEHDYVRCKINNTDWKHKSGGWFSQPTTIELFIYNDTIKLINIEGTKYKDKSSDYISHDEIAFEFMTNIPINELKLPITFDLSNATTSGRYYNGFITEKDLANYTYNMPHEVYVYDFVSGSLTLESLTRYTSCYNKPRYIDENGKCYEFKGSFNFIGENDFNEQKKATNGVFKLKTTLY